MLAANAFVQAHKSHFEVAQAVSSVVNLFAWLLALLLLVIAFRENMLELVGNVVKHLGGAPRGVVRLSASAEKLSGQCLRQYLRIAEYAAAGCGLSASWRKMR
jgi:hypothetical protein